MNRRLATEIFLLPGEEPGQTVVYAPLRRLAFVVNDAGKELLERFRDGVPAGAAGPDQAAFAERLEAMGLFEELDDRPPGVAQPHDSPYRPTAVTLFLTGKCNLHCSYCYARGGETDAVMPWEVAHAAIDFVIANALERNHPEIQVVFHGDGEPTLAWRLMKRAIEYAEDRSGDEGLRCAFEAGSNGILSERNLRWLAPHMRGMTISLDGPPDINDLQRPLAVGRSATGDAKERLSPARIVERSLRILDELGTDYGIRCTITARSVDRMPEVAEYLCSVSKTHHIQLEPMIRTGRALEGNDEAVDPETFVRGFLEARQVARRHGRRLIYSGARADQITNRFCEAVSGAFNVTQDGRISSCYEVFSETDARLSYFGIGGYDRRSGTFVVDGSKIRAAARWSALEKAPCQTCFAKYHCAGDCSAKLAIHGDPANTVDANRCYVIREITRAQIFSLYDLGDVVEPSLGWEYRPLPEPETLVRIGGLRR